MHIKYFGDSYDVVKQSLLKWLQAFGEWSVHPMFTASVPHVKTSAFEALLGAKVISRSVLTSRTERSAYFACAHSCGNLFLDPNTGLRLQDIGGTRAPNYLFASELVQLAEHRPESLTVVFDQSLQRGKELSGLNKKLRHLLHRKVYTFACAIPSAWSLDL